MQISHSHKMGFCWAVSAKPEVRKRIRYSSQCLFLTTPRFGQVIEMTWLHITTWSLVSCHAHCPAGQLNMGVSHRLCIIKQGWGISFLLLPFFAFRMRWHKFVKPAGRLPLRTAMSNSIAHMLLMLRSTGCSHFRSRLACSFIERAHAVFE